MRISDWSSDVCSSDLSHPDEGDGDAVDRGGDGAVDRRVAAGAVERFAGERRHQFGAAEPGGARLVLAPCEDGAPDAAAGESGIGEHRSEEHTSELQSLMRISYAVFCLKKKNN